MNETTVLAGNESVIHPDGDLVAAKLPALRTTLRELAAAGVLQITVDMTGIRAVDSAGLGLLIAAQNSLKKSGGALTVVHASREILDLFRTMRMHKHFTVVGI